MTAKHAAPGERAPGDDVEGLDRGGVLLAGVADVEDALVGREGQPVGLVEALGHRGGLARARVVAVDEVAERGAGRKPCR